MTIDAGSGDLQTLIFVFFLVELLASQPTPRATYHPPRMIRAYENPVVSLNKAGY